VAGHALRSCVAGAVSQRGERGQHRAGGGLHGLVPSAVSKRIADLEALVGVPLLSRHRRGVELTPAGRDLLRHADALRDAVDRMEAEMGAHATGRRGAIRVAANSSSISQFLPEDLAEFVMAHPDLTVHLTEMTSVEVIEAVRAGRADLGIFSGLTEGRWTCRSCPIGATRWWWWCPPIIRWACARRCGWPMWWGNPLWRCRPAVRSRPGSNAGPKNWRAHPHAGGGAEL
jgi:DNA-binding transcriptional LysR family regulator